MFNNVTKTADYLLIFAMHIAFPAFFAMEFYYPQLSHQDSCG